MKRFYVTGLSIGQILHNIGHSQIFNVNKNPFNIHKIDFLKINKEHTELKSSRKNFLKAFSLFCLWLGLRGGGSREVFHTPKTHKFDPVK